MIIHVELNGTDKNPWHLMGLTQNPFPQEAKHEVAAHMLALQSLGGDPIPDIAYIEKRLEGWSEEFVQMCCDRFVPGKMVKFDVRWDG